MSGNVLTPPVRPVGRNVVRVGLVLGIAFAVLAAGSGYWQVLEASTLTHQPDNPAVVAAARDIVRGRIYDRNGTLLATSKKDKNGEPYRVYTEAALAPLIGYASRQYGTAGLERAWDTELTGVNRGDPVRELFKKFDPNPYDPQDLHLSISVPLQQAAVKALGDNLGAVVMLDPRTGEVYALASTPVYDNSAVANPATSEKAFTALQKNRQNPLVDRATQGLYTPGSVFKIVTAIAGLGSGSVTPETTYPEQPKAETAGLLVDGYRVVDGHHPFTGKTALDFYQATEVSCNIWYALTGLKTGGGNLAQYAGLLGFGAPIPFQGLPTGASQVTNGGGSLPGGFKNDVELANAAYGQGETLATPLQMALVAATIANGGVLMAPHVVTSTDSAQGGAHTIAPQVVRTVVSTEVAGEILRCHGPGGGGPVGSGVHAGCTGVGDEGGRQDGDRPAWWQR